MRRIEREQSVIRQMIDMYCRRNHNCATDGLCDECRELLDYAVQRLGRCPHGDRKPSCRKCTIHCYSPQNRLRIKAVMRYVGPRMLFVHPIAAFRHLATELLR